MIPKRLELRNFLPYRDPAPLDFEGIHLACLTGQNGAGKSSILDAITWAIWGKARGNLMNDLVHQGQTEMSVTLDFEHEDADYRIKRTRSTAGKGQTFMEFFVRTPENKWELRNDTNLNATQKRIEELLHLDYDTFIVTAYLQQGKADAFTTKTAAERKRVLFDILGLDVWETYLDRAKAKLEALNRDEHSISMRLRDIETELGREAEYKRQRDDAQKVFDDTKQRLDEASEALDLVKHAPRELEATNKEYADVNRRLGEYEREVKQAQQDIEKITANIAKHHDVLERTVAIEAGYQALQEATAQKDNLTDQLRVVKGIEGQRNDLERAIASTRAELERQRAGVLSRMEVLARTANAENAEAYLALNAQIAELEEQESTLTALQEQIATQKEARGELKKNQDTLKDEGEKLKMLVKNLENTQEAVCPFCGQPLTPEHLETVLAENKTQLETKRHEWLEARNAYNALAETIKASEATVKVLQKAVVPLADLRTKRGKQEQKQQEAQDARLRLSDAERELETLTSQLDSEDYAHAEREALAQLDNDLAEIAYDDSQHDMLQDQIKTYQAFADEYHLLEVAKKMLPEDLERLENEKNRLKKWQKASQDETEKLAQIAERTKELTAMAQEYAQRDAEHKRQRTRNETARDTLIQAKQKLNSLEDQRVRKQELMAERRQIDEQVAQYKEIQMAFSKNGVPSMVMETAIPELEALSNDLLGRMTGGRMHLRLTTQKMTHSTETLKETLEIEISDELGTRNYELYSGGEAFRINFALRVALAKLLARRAGAHLQTLIVDEGFGTQDEEGRAKLVEAITHVQDDFKMILVITHLEDLRDAFPVHIVVEKTTNGSRVSVR